MRDQAATLRSPRLEQAAILVGGLGSRLGTLTATLPKPLMPVGDRPFLAWLLRELQRFGVQRALLLAGYRADDLRASLPALLRTLPRPMQVVITEEPAGSGTGGALWHARDLLEPRFLLCNGDSLFDANLAGLLADAARDPPDVALRLWLRRTPDAGRAGTVTLDGDRVQAFHQQAPPGTAVINAGVYVAARDALLPPLLPTCSLEGDILPALAAAGTLRGTTAEGWFIDIGVPADLARAQATLPSRLHRPALILDRDGVLNVDHGHVGSRDRFDWMPGALAAVATASAQGWHVFIATNQSGIARGYYTEADLAALQGWIEGEALAAGGTFDDWRFCPNHPEAPLTAYRRVDDWRKPGPGMLLDLARAWELDPARCVMVGDHDSDRAAAAAAGMEGHVFTGGATDLHGFVADLLARDRVPAS